MPKLGTYGSVRGAPSDGRPYRDCFEVAKCQGNRVKLLCGNEARCANDSETLSP
jgi:hypothetical protein